MLYRKLKRTWNNGYVDMAEFKQAFPELRKLNHYELKERFEDLNMEFYHKEETPVKTWIRFTLPFAVIAMALMTIGLPFNFMVTGQWGYLFGNNNRFYNWFVSLRLIRK